MKPDIRWLDDPRIFRVGQMDAHSDHTWYPDASYAQKKDNPWELSLNGEWEFSYSPDPASRPMDFFLPESDRSGFGRITVPGHIELSGYAQIQYINTLYPWDGREINRALDIATQLAENVPVLKLICRPDEDAVKTLKKYLEGRYAADI